LGLRSLRIISVNGKGTLKMSERVVSYDFDIQSIVAVDAPYGTDPDTLIEQVFIKLIQRARHQDIELVCENTFDPETGAYEDIPDEWYKERIEHRKEYLRKKTHSEEMQDDLEPLED